MKSKRYLILGDIHAPWTNLHVLEWIYTIAADLQPDYIIQVGDLYDYFSCSRFARRHDLCTPEQEVIEGFELATNMWATFNKEHKKAVKYQLKGNHDDRPYKRMLEKVPELAPFYDDEKFFTFKNVRTIKESRKELYLGGYCFLHGYLTGIGKHAHYNIYSTIHGHTHKGGCVFFPVRLPADNKDGYIERLIFELDVGFLGDVNSVPMKYSPQTYTKWTLGVGVIDEWGPRFMPWPGVTRKTRR